MKEMREEALRIINESIKDVLPEEAVKKALINKKFTENVIVIAIGKAAWNMAMATKNILGERIEKGLIITKYGHSKGEVDGFEIIEAGHPIPDENSIKGASKALELVNDLTANDRVILLISGGGSSLFEKPMDGVQLKDIIDITNQLLKCGANIIEINTVRKHLSRVKGGRFAVQCSLAQIYTIVLSDVLGDRLDTIASGPAYPDSSTSEEALNIINKYNIKVSENQIKVLEVETPKEIKNCETVIAGSVSELCNAVANNAQKLGYNPIIISSTLDCEAKEAGKFIASIAREIKGKNTSKSLIKPPCAIIAGGETVVKISGNGKGGRNQETALSAAIGTADLDNVIVFSLGSDGTDGPTDAAGGIVDGKTVSRMTNLEICPEEYLANNDSYNALKTSGDLIITGPTGTNVNDVIVLLCK